MNDAPWADAMWFLGIILPLALIGTAFRFVVVESAGRRQNTLRAIARQERWMSTSLVLEKAHKKAVCRWRTCWNRGVPGRMTLRVKRAVLVVIYRALAGVIDYCCRGSGYLSESKRIIILSDKKYLAERYEHYTKQYRRDRRQGQRLLMVTWREAWRTVFFQEGALWSVASGVFSVVICGWILWTVDARAIAKGWESYVVVVVIAMLWLMWVGNSVAKSGRHFTWGAGIVVFLGLSTIDRSSLGGLAVGNAVNAQEVGVMCWAFGLVLLTGEMYEQRKRRTNMEGLESEVLRRSFRLSRLARLVHRQRMKWAALDREYGWGVLVIWLYVAVGARFVGTILMQIWSEEWGPGIVGVMPIGVVTLCTIMLGMQNGIVFHGTKTRRMPAGRLVAVTGLGITLIWLTLS